MTRYVYIVNWIVLNSVLSYFLHMEKWENWQAILKINFNLYTALKWCVNILKGIFKILNTPLKPYDCNYALYSDFSITSDYAIRFVNNYTTALKWTVYFNIFKQPHCTHTHGIITCWYLPAWDRTPFLHSRHIEKLPMANFTQSMAPSHQWPTERVPDVVVSHKCRVTN